MRNVKSGVRIVNAKQKCPLFAVRALLFFEKQKLVAEAVGLWSRGARVWAAGGQRAAERPVDGHSDERVVHGLSTRPEGRFFWDTHHRTFFGTPIVVGTPTPTVVGTPTTATRTPQQGHPSRALPEPGLRAHRDPLDPGGDGCPCGRPVLAVGLGRWLSLRPLYDGCPCGRLSLRPTSTASCPPTSSAPLSRRPRLNGSSRGAARGHAGPPVRRLCGHGARHATLGRSQRCGSARVLESRDGQDHSHGRYPLALPG